MVLKISKKHLQIEKTNIQTLKISSPQPSNTSLIIFMYSLLEAY